MNRLAQEVESVLNEAVGAFIARASVKKNCELIGTTPDNLTADQLPELAEKIARSVCFFSGKDVGEAIAERASRFPQHGPMLPFLE